MLSWGDCFITSSSWPGTHQARNWDLLLPVEVVNLPAGMVFSVEEKWVEEPAFWEMWKAWRT